jgi:hypothetical protein
MEVSARDNHTPPLTLCYTACVLRMPNVQLPSQVLPQGNYYIRSTKKNKNKKKKQKTKKKTKKKKKKTKKKKKRKRPKDAHQKRPKLPILFFGPWPIIYIWHLWYCFKPMPILAYSWLIYFGLCGIV